MVLPPVLGRRLEPLAVTYREADLTRLNTVPVAGRPNKVDPSLLAAPPGADRSFAAFLVPCPTCSPRGICAPSSPGWRPRPGAAGGWSCWSGGTW